MYQPVLYPSYIYYMYQHMINAEHGNPSCPIVLMRALWFRTSEHFATCYV